MRKARQISVSLQNKPGSLAHFCGCLAERNINIIAISVAETTEQGVVRMIVDKPASALKMINEYFPLTYSETDVLLMDLPNEVGALAQLANKLSARKVNANFVYGSTGPGVKKSYIVVGAKNIDAAVRALRSKK
jgi:hypothetical protein